MAEYAVLVLERVTDGRTEEHHVRIETWDEVLAKVNEARSALPSWIAMTIVHASDYPRLLNDGAHRAPVDTYMVRDVLVALCERDGLSLDSEAEPGTPARNFELALRLGIGRAFGLGDAPESASATDAQTPPQSDESATSMSERRQKRVQERLSSTDDAYVWAEEFAKVCPHVDPGLMVGWFANAIETAKALEHPRTGGVVRREDAPVVDEHGIRPPQPDVP
jgi:hypothetical protein